MTLQDLIQKLRQYPVSSVCFILAVILGGATYWRSLSMNDVEAKFQQLSSEGLRIENNIKNSVNLEHHLDSLETIMVEAESRLIRVPELAQNLQYFYRLESETGVRISTANQLPVAPPVQATPRRGRPRVEEPAKHYQPVGFNLTLSGEYLQVMGFMNALETGRHFFRLTNFSMQRSTEAGAMSVSLTVNLELMGES